jgi:cytoskeletal protein RodZ
VMKVTPATEAECGLNLPGRRKALGLSLENIADSTKISMRFLRAIEDEEFEKLPGGIFNTSYLKQYAAATGFDEAKLLMYYLRTTQRSESEEQFSEPSPRGFLRWLRIPAPAGR